MSVDYGPVPVSRLKEESRAVFDALETGRRVLVSRYGEVVAQIEPPDVHRDAVNLAVYAVGERSAFGEMTATDLGQGSPSEFVRRAESGELSYVTRDSKVVGVLHSYTARPRFEPEESAEFADQREAYLAAFEQANPEATPDEFAAAVASWRPTLPATFVPQPASAYRGRLLSHALLVKGQALVDTGHEETAEETLRELIVQFEDDGDGEINGNVTQAMVQLADLYARTSRPHQALGLVDAAIDRIASPEALPAASVREDRRAMVDEDG